MPQRTRGGSVPGAAGEGGPGRASSTPGEGGSNGKEPPFAPDLPALPDLAQETTVPWLSCSRQAAGGGRERPWERFLKVSRGGAQSQPQHDAPSSEQLRPPAPVCSRADRPCPWRACGAEAQRWTGRHSTERDTGGPLWADPAARTPGWSRLVPPLSWKPPSPPASPTPGPAQLDAPRAATRSTNRPLSQIPLWSLSRGSRLFPFLKKFR